MVGCGASNAMLPDGLARGFDEATSGWGASTDIMEALARSWVSLFTAAASLAFLFAWAWEPLVWLAVGEATFEGLVSRLRRKSCVFG